MSLNNNLEEKLREIKGDLQKVLPDGCMIGMTQEFIDDVNASLNEPPKTWPDRIKESCDENIINTTIELNHWSHTNIKMTVTLDKANYGDYLYWRVVCDPPCKTKWSTHPFARAIDKDDKDITELGEVVADNEMIRTMFKFLAMPDNELHKHVGNSSTTNYRATIIAAIVQLWD